MLFYDSLYYTFNSQDSLYAVVEGLASVDGLEKVLTETQLIGVNARDWSLILLRLLGNPVGIQKTRAPLKAVYGQNKGQSNYWVLFSHPLLLNENGTSKRFKRGMGKSLEETKQVAEGINLLLSDPQLWTVSDIYDLSPRIPVKAIEIFFDQEYFQGTIYPFSCLRK